MNFYQPSKPFMWVSHFEFLSAFSMRGFLSLSFFVQYLEGIWAKCFYWLHSLPCFLMRGTSDHGPCFVTRWVTLGNLKFLKTFAVRIRKFGDLLIRWEIRRGQIWTFLTCWARKCTAWNCKGGKQRIRAPTLLAS